jgi:rhodanese-related sulfurtransferase
LDCHAYNDGQVTAASSTAVGIPEVSRETLIRALRDRSLTLVDVLSPESFVAFHIPGAINLPVMDIARLASQVLPDRRRRIVTYCGGPT